MHCIMLMFCGNLTRHLDRNYQKLNSKQTSTFVPVFIILDEEAGPARVRGIDIRGRNYDLNEHGRLDQIHVFRTAHKTYAEKNGNWFSASLPLSGSGERRETYYGYCSKERQNSCGIVTILGDHGRAPSGVYRIAYLNFTNEEE
jgi:hypothetical protein